MKILGTKAESLENIVSEAVEVLAAGGIIVYPTETCYGLGADATNPEAIAKLSEYKSRREGQPLSVAVYDMESAQEYVEVNELALNMYENYLPGPITVVSKVKEGAQLADGVASEYGTLGIRVPDHKFILEICKAYGKPITATSANISYKKKPYSIEALEKDTPVKRYKMLDLIIDHGELPKNEASTVVDTTLNNLNIMRPGAISFEKDLKDRKLSLEATTYSEEETISFGGMVMLKYVKERYNTPVILALKGDLGAGKTQFAKGIAKSLKIDEQISSPTFTIIDEYEYVLADTNGKFIHMDTWRVDGAEELDRTGIEEFVKVGNILAIEWADKFYDQIKGYIAEYGGTFLTVTFEHISPEVREIKVYEGDVS